MLLVLASCKNAQEDIAEKQKCFKRCMLENDDDKTYCLDDCDIEEKDIVQDTAQLCGNGICEEAEKTGSLCAKDCEVPSECTIDVDCGEKKICTTGKCIVVECTLARDCDEGYGCESNVCVKTEEEFDTTAVTDGKNKITDLKNNINALLNQVAKLQSSLDASDASESDKEIIQNDIDDLDTAIIQLKVYNSTLSGYADDLNDAKTNDDVAFVTVKFSETKESVTKYLSDQQSIVDEIQTAINNLEPLTTADLKVTDLTYDDLNGNDATFNVSYKNSGDEDISSSETFRMRLSVFDFSNDSYDSSKSTITTGLDADEAETEQITVEMPYDDIIDYFADNEDETDVGVIFLIELDIDNSINESNETNNLGYFNITFDKEDFVTNVAPVAVLSVNATSIMVGEEISFSATNSTDSDGSISSYNWNFGDTYSSTSVSPTYSYVSQGTYTVTLTVTDDEGATATDTETITVS